MVLLLFMAAALYCGGRGAGSEALCDSALLPLALALVWLLLII